MNRPSEQRAPGGSQSLPTAQVLPFERPQTELQKAVQQRAQETIDLARDRAAAHRPKPLQRVIVLLLATIPVALTFGAAIGFVGALKRFNATIFGGDSATEQPAPLPTSAPPDTAEESGVVILQPYAVPGAAPREQSSSPGSPAP
jgi:hypothetical protein